MQNFTAECNFGILNMLLDNTSFENLYYEYSDRLCNYASHYLSDRAMAGDIVQDAYIHLWEKYKGKESEEWHPLLFTMVRNRCIDRLRHLEFSGTRAFVTPLSEVCEDRLYHSDFHSDSFNREDRKVSLSGEAFFDVTYDEDLPFIVELGGSSITVKGTRFDVAAYSSEEDITAALLEGSIIFRSENAIVDLHPGEVLTYDLKDESILRSQADVDSYAAWINGKPDYPEVTLDKLLDRLSSIYGVDFVYFPEKYREKKFRIILNGDESLSDLLEAISFVAPMEYEMKDGKIYIKER